MEHYEGKRKMDVLLNIPNIISYARSVLFVWGIWRSQTDGWIWAASMYFVNCVLDIVDGVVARRFNQCSKLGAMVDHISDLIQMVMWKIVLCQLYPEYSFSIMIHVALSIMFTTTFFISCEILRVKSIWSDSTNPLLRHYYGFAGGWIREFTIYGYWCFWLMLYITKFTNGPFVAVFDVGLCQILLWFSIPWAAFRSLVMLNSIFMAGNIFLSIDIRVDANGSCSTKEH